MDAGQNFGDIHGAWRICFKDSEKCAKVERRVPSCLPDFSLSSDIKNLRKDNRFFGYA